MSCNSKLLKWAYFPGVVPYSESNICYVFWHAFVINPLLCILATLLLIVASPALITVIILIILDNSKVVRFINEKFTNDIVIRRIVDFKNKICTRIEIE